MCPPPNLKVAPRFLWVSIKDNKTFKHVRYNINRFIMRAYSDREKNLNRGQKYNKYVDLDLEGKLLYMTAGVCYEKMII